MAKEQVHNWLRTAVLLAGIVFAGGGYAMKVNSMDKDITKNEEKIDEVEDAVVKLRLDAKDIAALASTAAEAMSSIEIKFNAIQVQLSKQATIQAVNSEKLKTLTR